jgi:hypothetical protein
MGELGGKVVRVDADGLGAGVYDSLVEVMGRDKVKEIRGGRAAIDSERFFNSRSEMLWTLRESLRPDADVKTALPPDGNLTAQITSIRWSVDSRGRIAVESKDDYKKRTGQGSPDELDACAYAIARGVRAEKKTLTINPSLGHTANAWRM